MSPAAPAGLDWHHHHSHSEATVSTPTTLTLQVPGATLTYDIRGDAGADAPLLLIGCPMAAAGFGTLAGTSPTAGW